MDKNKSLSCFLPFWKKAALSIILERAVWWKWARLCVFLAAGTVCRTPGLGVWQEVRADSENPATIESSWTQVLPGLILQFGCFQLNVKQLWPFICSSHWNPSEGKLSPIFSSPPQACSSAFWRQTGAGTANWQKPHQKKKRKRKEKVAFLISGQSNEILIQPFIFQCLHLGTRRTASKIRTANMNAVRGCHANRFVALRQQNKQMKPTWGWVLKCLWQCSTCWVQHDFFYRKGLSFKEGIFNSQLVGFWKRLRTVSNGPPGTSTGAKGFQKSSWWELPNSSTPAKCTVYEPFSASSSILEPSNPSMAWLSLLAWQGLTLFFPLRKRELGSILRLSLDNRNVRLLGVRFGWLKAQPFHNPCPAFWIEEANNLLTLPTLYVTESINCFGFVLFHSSQGFSDMQEQY